jgi:hypothetical protein
MDLALRQLIEFDMWCYIRQKADSQGSQALYSALLTTMKGLELEQSGIQKCIIPDASLGYGWPCYGCDGYDHYDPLATAPMWD